jgi:hypothetical protein
MAFVRKKWLIDAYQQMQPGAIGNVNVTLNLMSVLSLVLVAGISLAGCAAGGKKVGGADRGLKMGQVDAVTIAARQMVGNTAVQVHGLKSRRAPGEPGTHVCGYIKSAEHKDTPLYVELREKQGTFAAEHGQIGATPENLAKVKFMCRLHGDW